MRAILPPGIGSDASLPEAIAHIRGILERNELRLFCQPIRALSGTAAYAMAEVLVRMREEEAAFIPPGEFIPIFEHYRMMPAMDRWVLRNTVQHLARGSRVSSFTVNLDWQTLEDAEFPSFVGAELTEAGVAPALVLFELELKSVLTRVQACARFTSAIKAVGCVLVVDGFGVEPSTVGQLKALRPDFIKLEGSITRGLLKDAAVASRLKSVLQVTQSLGIRTIAEAVEDEEIVARLKAVGVDFAQGFGIYLPHPIGDFAR
jgi:EAL domain-containing protein (putative c-di-GMP-specific phosphodiesterase class I)